MTATLLVAGTASHVGKSTVACGFCRLLADRGVDVAPFKAQNMSNNARAVPRDGQHGGSMWGEIGVSQYIQARAARTPAHVDVNPVLLKPRGEGESQLVIHGEPIEHVSTRDYYQDRWEDAREAVLDSYANLAAEHDVIVAEGAGSMAEPNLADRDLANVETARLADARILLVADIDRGGAFAHLVGTLDLAPADLRQRVIGLVLTKFRGDRSLLDPAIETVEHRTGVPVLGVLPHDDPGLPAEDSVALSSTGNRVVRGTGDGISSADCVTVAVPRLPHISNFTDLEPLASEPGVRVAYVPLDGTIADADGVVVPGTKNTVDDLLALRNTGLATALVEFDGPIVGLCGGYQLLGERLEQVGIESTRATGQIEGLGLLPVETRFTREKHVEEVERSLTGTGPLAGADGRINGYEIHMGRTRPTGPVARPVGGRGAATADVFGTYLHGLFENRIARRAFCETMFQAGDRSMPSTASRERTPIARAADQLREYVDLGPLDLPGTPP